MKKVINNNKITGHGRVSCYSAIVTHDEIKCEISGRLAPGHYHVAVFLSNLIVINIKYKIKVYISTFQYDIIELTKIRIIMGDQQNTDNNTALHVLYFHLLILFLPLLPHLEELSPLVDHSSIIIQLLMELVISM